MPDLFDAYGHPIVNIDAGAIDLFDQYGRPYMVPVYPASVAFTAGLVANRPAAGTEGALYFATDEQVLYRDNGSAWVQVAYPGTPTVSVADFNKVDDLNHIMDLVKRGTFRFRPMRDLTATATGSGNGWQSSVYAALQTGGASSTYKLHGAAFWMAGMGVNMPWSRRMLFHTSVLRYTADASPVTFTVHIRESTNGGTLNEIGIGFEVSNYTLVGVGYKTSRVATATLATLVDWQSVDILIDHQPAVPKIDFYVDTGSGWGSAVSITNAAGIPSVDSLNNASQVFYLTTGVGGADCGAYIYPWYCWVSRS